MTNENIDKYASSVDFGGVEYYKNLVFGQQMYSTILHSYLCSNVTQDYKLYRKNLRTSPRENILCEYLQETFPNSLRHDEKIRKSYLLMSTQYHMQGYDAVYSALRRIMNKYFAADAFAEKRAFQSKYADFTETDELVLTFADRYGLNHLLTRLALLTRSRMGEDHLRSIGVIKTMSAKEATVLKRGLIDFGKELLLLSAFDYCSKNHIIDSINLSAFDEINSNLEHAEIQSRMEKLLCLDEFCVSLFKTTAVPVKDSLTDKDRIQIVCGLIAAFFLSNFAPDKKFTSYFNDSFERFFTAEKISANTDYRFEVSAYLSAFELKPKTVYREIGGGIFHAEVVIGSSKGAFRFVCENESMRFAKKEVWRIAYEQIIVPVKRFFESADDDCIGKAVSFFIHKVCDIRPISAEFFAGYGILFAENFLRMSPNICAEVMRKARSCADNQTFADFLRVICKANTGKYICVNESVYSYVDWMRLSCGDKKSDIIADDADLAMIYDNIVNPTTKLQKKLISTDYRFVQKICPLSDEIALYALDVNLDAYNYLPFVSSSAVVHYDKLRMAYLTGTDILSTDLGAGVTAYIMDSQKPFHVQIKQLTSRFKIKKIQIACGYCFASGLSLLSDIIQKELIAGTFFELYVGSLQNYDESVSDNIITGIDKTTVRLLNQYLSFSNFSLYTCPDRFFHGKIYIFEGEDTSTVIVGSSNISRAAFVSNYELNLAFHIPAGGILMERFLSWINQLQRHSKRITTLNENMFGDGEIKFDGTVLIKRISAGSMLNKIRRLTDSEVQYRLNLWMSYEPDIIAEDLGISSLPDYFVFVYNKHKLIVLESFESGNAYFCLKAEDSFENIINRISSFSKTEIFVFSKMTKRGYHVPNKFTLENNIRQYFRGK